MTRDPALEASRWGDWLEDLKHLQLDVVEATASAWRRSDKAFAPTPGQFLSVANPMLARRKALYHRTQQILARQEEPPRPTAAEKAEAADILDDLERRWRGSGRVTGERRHLRSVPGGRDDGASGGGAA